MALTVRIQKRLSDFQLDVAFEAPAGVTALLGASGCGKSLTLKCIAGVERPDTGYIALDDRVLFDSQKHIDLPPQQRGVGFLFQHYALFPNMSVADNIEAGLTGSRHEKHARREALVHAYRLDGLETHYPHELSGGQQQRVALCRMLAREPSVLLLDEPFSALDSHLRWQTEREIAGTLAGFPGTALLVSHDRGEVYRLSERVCVMHEGKSEPVCGTRALFDAPRTRIAALLSGCKNFSAFTRVDAHTLRADDWGGAQLHAEAGIPPAARYVGARAHFLRFGARDEENAVPVTLSSVDEDVFSMIYTASAEGGESIRLELQKGLPDMPVPGERTCVVIPPDAMMLLE